MAYPFRLIVNFDILADCHTEASTKPGELETIGLDPESATQEIETELIKTEKHYHILKSKLQKVLSKYSLEEHEDHFLYLFHLFYENDAPYFILKEEEVKHAASRVKKLIELQCIKEQCSSKNLVVSIKSKTKALSVSFDTPIIDDIWENLYNSLLNSSIRFGNNPLLLEYLRDNEITWDLLLEVASNLKYRTGSFWNKAIANFSAMLLFYLNKTEIFRGDTPMTSQQARLIFDLLQAFRLIKPDKVTSEEDDYIKALLRNNNLL
jgi:hypothetical protein